MPGISQVGDRQEQEQEDLTAAGLWSFRYRLWFHTSVPDRLALCEPLSIVYCIAHLHILPKVDSVCNSGPLDQYRN